MATTYQLSIDIADFGGTDSEGVLIEIRLTTAGGDILDYATASAFEIVEGGVVASGETNSNGQATFHLVATTHMQPASKYEAAIDVEGGTPYRVVFEMPTSAANLAQLIIGAAPPVTPVTPVIPTTGVQNIVAGWSTDTTVTIGELNVGAAPVLPLTDTVVIPNASGNQYLFVWRADADGGDPTEVHVAGGGNQRNVFGVAIPFTYQSVAGQLIISITTQNASLLSAETLRTV